MTTVNNIGELGFTSWTELYQWLLDQDLQDHEEVELSWPEQVVTEERVADDLDGPLETIKTEARPDVKISTDYVKARAFEEVYPELPTRKAVDVVANVLRDRPITGHDVKIVANFVQNLKTRPQ